MIRFANERGLYVHKKRINFYDDKFIKNNSKNHLLEQKKTSLSKS